MKKSKFFRSTAKVLRSADPQLKDLIFHRLEQSGPVSEEEFRELEKIAYPGDKERAMEHE